MYNRNLFCVLYYSCSDFASEIWTAQTTGLKEPMKLYKYKVCVKRFVVWKVYFLADEMIGYGSYVPYQTEYGCASASMENIWNFFYLH